MKLFVREQCCTHFLLMFMLDHEICAKFIFSIMCCYLSLELLVHLLMGTLQFPTYFSYVSLNLNSYHILLLISNLYVLIFDFYEQSMYNIAPWMSHNIYGVNSIVTSMFKKWLLMFRTAIWPLELKFYFGFVSQFCEIAHGP